jgi:pimeloyl-ACP methyl ester carboxylesterase
VKGDLPASIVKALDGGDPKTVFVAGLCSNANAYLQSFPESARKHGGAIAVEGDQRCTDDGVFRSYSWDATKLNARIEKALAAAGVDPFPAEGITLVGYSQGAALGEQLASRFPARYSRIVVIGAPTEPNAANFARTKGVVTMSCSLDVPARMRDASKRIAKVGVPSTYLEMPKCHHGHVADPERVFDEAFSFLGT